MREPKKNAKLIISSKADDYTAKAMERLPGCVEEVMEHLNIKNKDILAAANPKYLKDYELSRILSKAQKGQKGYRPVHFEHMVELRKILPISLDKIADGENPLEWETMSDARLFERHKRDAAEIERRFFKRRLK